MSGRDPYSKPSTFSGAHKKQSDSPNRNCTACKKKPMQVQCLHCAEHVCLECAQTHVNLVAQESDGATHLLNEKLDVLDRISTNTRQKIVAERDKIVKQADAERDRSFALLAQMIEAEKQQIRNKNKELNELPLNEIPNFIRQLKSDLQQLIEKNENFFIISSSVPQITLRRQNEERDTRISFNRNVARSKFDDDDDDYRPSTRSKFDDDDYKPSTRPKFNDDEDDYKLSHVKKNVQKK